MNFRTLIKIILSLLIALSGITSIFYLIINRKEVKESLGKIDQKIFNKINPNKTNKDEFWAREILNGGYILFFRHAERDKWIDVKMFDAIEAGINNNGNILREQRFGENDYFSDAVCLNKRGKIQAKGMNEIIEFSKLPIGNIISSPSCRARQTAKLVFGKYDKIDKALVYKGPFLENEIERKIFIKDYLQNLEVKEGTNTIITAHNSVVPNDILKSIGKKTLEEGGFFIISNKDNKLVLKHTYFVFSNFSKIFFPRKFK